MAKNKERLKRKIIEQLEVAPVVFSICNQLNIPRSTYYRWLKEDEAFANLVENALEKGRLTINELAESRLIQKVETGDSRSIEYWLGNNSLRYMKPREKVRAPVQQKSLKQWILNIVRSDGKEYKNYEDLKRDKDGNIKLKW
jgi:hypothetical protein